MQSHTGCTYLTFLHCVFSDVSSECLTGRMHNHTGCICMTFLHCVSLNVFRKRFAITKPCFALQFLNQPSVEIALQHKLSLAQCWAGAERSARWLDTPCHDTLAHKILGIWFATQKTTKPQSYQTKISNIQTYRVGEWDGSCRLPELFQICVNLKAICTAVADQKV